METTHYKLKLPGIAGETLAKGDVEIAPGFFEQKQGFIDALLDLAGKAGYAIRWGGHWAHPTDSNFSPLEGECEIINGLIEYGACEESTPHRVDVGLAKVF